MADSQRTHISAFPLGKAEPSRIVRALQLSGFAADWVSNRQIGDAWLLEASREATIADNVSPQVMAEQLGLTIWQAIGRYVRIAVDITPTEADSGQGFELCEASYLRLTNPAKGQQKSPLC
ncbi:hypothetical protein [Chitinimonas sp. BJYL2]|uniref:hypothetical protein n=1 Tax=Chitinimonas sp. BJYL2 TaxID=2976696 RepID=UPI0022B56B08|nr:hypothetical protein [Chitinimonas sp. BJYL2]